MSLSNSSKDLSICPTKHTEASSTAGDLQDSIGLFTFSKQTLSKALPSSRHHSESRLKKHSKPFGHHIKTLEIESQILKEKIKALEIEITNSVFEESNILMHHIQKNQRKIESFREKLQILNNEQENLQKMRSEVEYSKGLERKNVELAQEIAAIKERIQRKMTSNIPKDRALMLADAVKKLEEQQLQNLKTNSELKQELGRLKAGNYAKGLSIVGFEDQEKLYAAYVDIYRMLCVCQKLYLGEQVRIKEFLEVPPGMGKTNPLELVGLIKDSTKALKMVISDIYADHCGNICQLT